MSSTRPQPGRGAPDVTAETLAVDSLGVGAVSSIGSVGHEVVAERYRVLGLLGSGGMGTVYRALDLELDETVALKVLKRELVSAPEALARFRQEAKLAREAEICYATMAMVTDYDCWHEDHDAVTVDQVVAVIHQNSANAAMAVRAAVAAMPKERTCPCATALKFAILTSPEAIPAATRTKLDLLLGKYTS